MPPERVDLAGSTGETGRSKERRPSEVTFAICTVEDSFAHAGAYLVRMPGGPLVVASDAFQFSCLPMGARPIGGYQPKASVLVCQFPALDHAIIIGAAPKSAAQSKFVLPDSMVLRSRAGIFEDPVHYTVFSNPKAAFGNYSAGRPADTLPGDWGSINDLGMAIFLGRIMASLRASDLAKVEAFWGDDLLRLVGYNLEVFTAGAEDRRINDQAEYNEILRMTPFPWEGLGMGTQADATTVVNGTLKPGSEQARSEPKQLDQLMIARSLHFRGYLGDLDREFIAAPPSGLQPETYTAKTTYRGLADILKHINGAVAIRSAKEVILEKYSLLPIPKELIAPEDPLGDNETNYKFSDLVGSGEGYQMPEFIWGDDTDANIRPSQLFDYQAYFFSKYTMGGLAAHKKDWYLPDESDLTQPVAKTVYDKTLAIGHQFLAPLPGFGELVIDQRPGHSARYYRSRSCIHQADDGSIVIEDGYGSQIQMKGGSIFMSCVGDVWQLPGRNAVVWAPHDAIMRAGNCADISASKADVRIKAERNLHMLAGNDQSHVGGVLIECRSQGPSTANDFEETGQLVEGHGITLKAAKSTIHAMGQNIYIGRNQTNAGDVIIDAGKQGTAYLRGQNVYTRATQLIAMLMASDTNPNKQVMAININGTLISTPLEVGGNVNIVPTGTATEANVFIGGALAVLNQIEAGKAIATNSGFAARKGAPQVSPLDRDIVLPDPTTITSVITQEITDISNGIQVEENRTVQDQNQAPGNDNFQTAVGFSCRDTVRDLKLQAANFLLYEARWQQMLRVTGGNTKWDEPVVKAPTQEDTRPHPGNDGWENFQAYGTIENVNFDLSAGRANARASMTEQGSKPQKQALKAGYIVNVQM